MQGDARVLRATSRRRRAENPAAKSRSGAALMTAQPVVLGPGQERQFWTSVSHGTVKVESGTTCPPTTGRWYGKLGINYERLVQIKRRYDPDNIFRLNHNIDPAQ
jgi:hypothetical protein